MKLIALMPLSLIFVLFCASSVEQIKFVNNDFIWSVTCSSYCIVLIRHFEEEKKSYKNTLLNLTWKVTSNKISKKCPCKPL